MKMLPDTDISGDIDDALALAYLLRKSAWGKMGFNVQGLDGGGLAGATVIASRRMSAASAYGTTRRNTKSRARTRIWKPEERIVHSFSSYGTKTSSDPACSTLHSHMSDLIYTS